MRNEVPNDAYIVPKTLHYTEVRLTKTAVHRNADNGNSTTKTIGKWATFYLSASHTEVL